MLSAQVKPKASGGVDARFGTIDPTGPGPYTAAFWCERVAQTVEHVTFNHGVLGSIPSALTKQFKDLRIIV
jgi:hypothetical protein